MQLSPVYDEVIEDIKRFFAGRIEACISAGISEPRQQIENLLLVQIQINTLKYGYLYQ
jgi:hypothetical protein